MRVVVVAALCAVVLAACSSVTDATSTPPAGNARGAHTAAIGGQGAGPPAAHGDPGARRAFFGELHLHTSYSFDAYGLSESRTDPDLAYRFARGEAVQYLGKRVQRHEPLDFMAVTDHAEYLGFLNQLDDPESALSRGELGRRFHAERARAKNPGEFLREVTRMLSDPVERERIGVPGARRSAWERTITAANVHYRPGSFTTLIGYEWTSHPEYRYNLHRNVIFRGDRAPEPFTALDSLRPEDLWSYLEAHRDQGVEALAIPHNANGSEGHMFAWTDSEGRQIDRAYAQRRALNEPLNEIYQSKGQSETLPALSPADEFANFEVLDRLIPRLDLPGVPPGSYARDALGRGLLIEQRTGANPYKFGAVAGTDFHNGLSTSAENAFQVAYGFDPQVDMPTRAEAEVLLSEAGAPSPLVFGSGGLTGVWAERNDRESIYGALRRRETFATSGPRIAVRLFAGWRYGEELPKRRDWLQAAYAGGVPMGSDLPRAEGTGPRIAPRFLVWAVKDPNGASLERAQVVKIWLDGATSREKIHDVAHGPATEFAAGWSDPEFDPRQPAVYYLRVLEVPTPRWSTILARRYGLQPPEKYPQMLQERAWSSPIWYSPR